MILISLQTSSLNRSVNMLSKPDGGSVSTILCMYCSTAASSSTVTEMTIISPWLSIFLVSYYFKAWHKNLLADLVNCEKYHLYYVMCICRVSLMLYLILFRCRETIWIFLLCSSHGNLHLWDLTTSLALKVYMYKSLLYFWNTTLIKADVEYWNSITRTNQLCHCMPKTILK